MSSSALLKRDFLNKWIKGLRLCRNMTLSQRQTAIKTSADVAIASTRTPATQWSRALLRDVVSRDRASADIAERIAGQKVENTRALIACSNRIIRRSHVASRKAKRLVPRSMKSRTVARKSVQGKITALKKLVPGGERMSEVCLIRETLDYIVSLRAQADVMRAAAETLEKIS